jgi:hypothetical protein
MKHIKTFKLFENILAKAGSEIGKTDRYTVVSQDKNGLWGIELDCDATSKEEAIKLAIEDHRSFCGEDCALTHFNFKAFISDSIELESFIQANDFID